MKKKLVFCLLLILFACNDDDNNNSSTGSTTSKVPEEFIKTFNLTCSDYSSGDPVPFADGASVAATFKADGTLTMDDGTTTITLEDPSEKGTTELSWSSDSFLYDVSNIETKAFNEINISDTSDTFLMQCSE